MNIREIRKEDKDQFLQLQRKLDEETIYMAFEKEDRDVWAKGLDGILDWIIGNKNSNIFVAEADGRLVGFLQISQHNLARTKHIGTVFIGIAKSSTGKGIGKQLFEKLFDWVKATELKRLELTVVQENEKAVGLYKKTGFEVEGEKKRAFKINDKFYDEFYMSKLI